MDDQEGMDEIEKQIETDPTFITVHDVDEKATNFARDLLILHTKIKGVKFDRLTPTQIPKLVSAIKENQTLETLIFSEMTISKEIIESLRNKNNVKILQFVACEFTASSSLATVIETLSLEKLSFWYCKVNTTDFPILMKIISRSNKVFFAGVDIDDKTLENNMPSLSNIKSLAFYSNKISSVGCATIAEKLKGCSISSLSLGCNRLGSDGIITIIDALPPSVKTLDISLTFICDKAIDRIALALKTNGFTVSKLNLSENRFSSHNKLFDALETNGFLQNLSLRNTGLHPKDVSLLMNSLNNNRCSALIILDLSDNAIGDEGAIAIASAISRNPYLLEELYLERCSIGDRGISELADALKTSLLEVIDVSYNRQELQGFKDLCESVEKTNHSLSALSLSIDKNFQQLEISCIVSMIRSNDTLKCLNLRGDLTSKNKDDLQSVIEKYNSTLTTLDIFYGHPPIDKALTINRNPVKYHKEIAMKKRLRFIFLREINRIKQQSWSIYTFDV